MHRFHVASALLFAGLAAAGPLAQLAAQTPVQTPVQTDAQSAAPDTTHSAAPPPDPRIATLLADLGKTRTPAEAALSPDGHYVAWTVRGDLHLSGIAPEGSAQDASQDRILSPESIHDVSNSKSSSCGSESPIWSPSGKQLAFLSTCDAKGENTKQNQIWIWTLASNQLRQLTHLAGNFDSPQWSPDGKAIAFLFVPNATRSAGALDAMKPAIGVIGKDNVEVQGISSVSLADGKVTSILPATTYAYEFSWAPDSQRLVYVAAPPPGENNWWVAKIYTLAMGQRPKLVVDPVTISGPLHGLQVAVPRFSPDGKNIAFIGGIMSDQGSTGGDIYITSAEGKDTHPFTAGRKSSPAWIEWADNDHLVFTEHDRGKVHAGIIGTSGEVMPVMQQTFDGSVGSGDGALSLSVSLKTKQVAFVRSSFEHPPEVYAGPLNRLQQISHLNDGLKPAWGKSESVEWINDGFHVQGWLLYPAHYDPGKKYPMVVMVHGGPSSEITERWPGMGYGAAPFSALGYFVFQPNPRGSYGQGEAFTQANIKDFGYGDLRDVLTGMDTLEARLPIDKNRIGLTGWSYGGFMTMFGVTQTNRFKAAVAGAGISNWQSYYGENSIDQWMTPFFGASVYDDPAVYAKSSAITYIKKVKTPTLIVVGERDGECPSPQSFEFWHALRAEGVQTELVIYPNEGHGFRDPAHRVDVLTRAFNWFEQQMPAASLSAAR